MEKFIVLLGFSTTIFLNSFSTKIVPKKSKTAVSTKSVDVNYFWNSLKALQGKTFEGTLVNAPANDDFIGKKLVMHVLYCDDETILIPFNVGDNLSRTWIFKKKITILN